MEDHRSWKEVQDSLKNKLIAEDDFSWKIPMSGPRRSLSMEEEEEVELGEVLEYVGGVDISFSKKDSSVACGILVVLDLHSLEVVYEDFSVVTLHVPYVPGFLAFREAPVLLQLLEKMKNCANPFYPQLLMVDGNGVLHPRGFGLACHLGVVANIPTIGVGKNLHHVDGLTLSGVKELLKARKNSCGDFINLIGDSGHVWGVAIRSTENLLKPIFISIGHRISLEAAIKIVKMTCKYRVPEPIRQVIYYSLKTLNVCFDNCFRLYQI
uniref:Endonuclease V n=1 Tax=Cannabis sativa TaxID=3483 RepID=A0A803NLE0_CANSA